MELCLAGIVLCFRMFNLAQFSGERLTAVAALLGLFGLASLPLTYFLHFFFTASHCLCVPVQAPVNIIFAQIWGCAKICEMMRSSLVRGACSAGDASWYS